MTGLNFLERVWRLFIFVLVLSSLSATALNTDSTQRQFFFTLPEIIIDNRESAKDFPILDDTGKTPVIVYDTEDYRGIARAVSDFVSDVRNVTGIKPDTSNNVMQSPSVIIGTVGKSRIIDNLAKTGRLNVKNLSGKWESFVITTLDGDVPTLVVAGSDKRGTIYGIYELSEQLGVSPWYWMADAPVKKRDSAFVRAGRYESGEPKVKYRGIFINDEWPSFGTWCNNQFGGINHKAYEKIFELLLRLKANYFWPAMWGSAFNEDDPESPETADEYGIVMGTSHHEPMMRAHQEYVRRKSDVGPWDYSANPERIEKFFREGLERNRDYENIITIGMRGDGDVAMGNGNDAENMATLRDVINSQRRIIKDVYGKNPKNLPQLWAIFTEVQRYYDAGFTVPDDVTLLLCDNNWGYIRRKGREHERNRKGGLGLYYHIDMNGGPWNDRWVNTTTVPKLREQLNLAYRSGIDRIWIINVGDLKPKEMPIDFIMRYAWNPEIYGPGDERAYLEHFAESIFDRENAPEIADLIASYSKYNLWRKPEAQYVGLFNIPEMLMLNNMWENLELRAEKLKDKLPTCMQDAFFQLVYYPVIGSATVAKIYNSSTIGDEENVELLMAKDRQLTSFYNDTIAGGKWRGMMLDNHIGYTQWSIPDSNRNPMTLGQTVDHPLLPPADSREKFIPAYRYSRKKGTSDAEWIFLPDLGRGKGCMGSSNVMTRSRIDGTGAVMEYDISSESDSLTVAIGILPTQDIYPERGLRLGVVVDDRDMKILDARKGLVDTFGEYTESNLTVSKVLSHLPPESTLALSGYYGGKRMPRRSEVFDNLRWLDVAFDVAKGNHTLKIVMIDPEIVIEQIVLNPDNDRYGYFPNGYFEEAKL